jgi:hypothetical protein
VICFSSEGVDERRLVHGVSSGSIASRALAVHSRFASIPDTRQLGAMGQYLTFIAARSPRYSWLAGNGRLLNLDLVYSAVSLQPPSVRERDDKKIVVKVVPSATITTRIGALA